MLTSRLHSISVKLLMIIIVGHVAGPQTALSYEIWPRKNVHETLTLMASDCLRWGSRETGPTLCLQARTSVSNKVLEETSFDLTTLRLGQISAKDLAKVVRWPDDPTVEVPGLSIIKFGLKMRYSCREYNDGLKHGLLCSSHYGPLQYWHGMASSLNERTVDTQRKMLAWAEFLYQVIVSDELFDTDHCKYWQNPILTREGKTPLSQVFAPEKEFPCPKNGVPWTVGTLFSMKCGKFWDSTECDVMPRRIARLNALGALLHMVQDSYAQGHAARGTYAAAEKTNRVRSKFECLPISQFYTYGGQDDGRHRRADFHPQPGRSCATGTTSIDDPILASAKVLWYVQQKKGEELDSYLEDRVFRLAADHVSSAGTGKCFAEQLPPNSQCPK